jgi:hypothetical protein
MPLLSVQKIILEGIHQFCSFESENNGKQKIVFKRKRMRHGLLASASILCKETFLLYCRLRMKA